MPRKQKKFHYIYKTTNKLNSKYYIGMHSTDDMEDGYLGSGKRLWYSINKHGKENHEIEYLEFFNTRKELKKREEEIVNEDLLKEDLCMNLTLGGNGGYSGMNKQSKEKISTGISNRNKNIWKNTEYRKKMKDALSSSMKNRWIKGEFKELRRFTGKKHSEESKEKISKTKKEKGSQLGSKNSQYGTCWICNDKEIKKIKKEDFSKYQSLGWKKGRKY